ncbi:N5-carboxyaminoimidazole ribonucleotide mutase [bacterium BMS3Abin07]|nr:N5-carboxyaminoimidazole ribonucleotide mutase [bacterium BMS3Abin07]GBE31667.1 N5-carboxyaminoimidazole ribonucleotide mutase [bacterium BMS3Bbin05]
MKKSGYSVLILMGSDSDLPVMQEAGKILDNFAVPYRMAVASAHRTPERVQELIRDAEKKGAEVIIAGAGMSAHLAGVAASHTILPVIGVPLDSSSLEGLDALLSTVQMPPGIPVGTMALGEAGAKNSAWFVLQMMALKDKKIRYRLKRFRNKLREEVEKKDSLIQKK